MKEPSKKKKSSQSEPEQTPPGFLERHKIAWLARPSFFIPIIIGVCAICVAAIWGIPILRNPIETGPIAGNRAPDFTLQTVNGEKTTLSDYRGKIVMLSYLGPIEDFWDYEEIDQEPYFLQSVRDKWSHKELAIVGITNLSTSDEISNFIAKYKLTFPILLDSTQKVAADYDIMHYRTHFFIDEKGIIRLVMQGQFQHPEEIENILDSIKNNTDLKNITPAISNISVPFVTDKSAVITWVTDEPATSQMIIDKSGKLTYPDQEKLVTNHSVALQNLEPDTTYYFQVLSGYNLQNQVLSEKHSFTTTADVSPPVILDIDISDVTESSAVITWSTNEPATSEVTYWTTGSENSTKVFNNELTANHSISLDDLQADTHYHIEIESKDASGYGTTLRIFPITTLSGIPFGIETGNMAPDFTLQTIDGKSMSLKESRGKIVLLKFWQARCNNCVREMPIIQAIYDKWSHDDLVILAVNVFESIETVQDFMDSHGFTFPALPDSSGEVDTIYKPHRFPTIFIIDREGIIRKVQEGAFQNQQEIEDILNSLQ